MTSIFLMIFFRLFFPFYFLLRAETEQDLAIPPPPDLASLLRASGDFRTQAADLAPIYANPSLVRRRQCGIRNPESGMAAMIVEFFDLCFFFITPHFHEMGNIKSIVLEKNVQVEVDVAPPIRF